jgi:hypothetical protein
MKNLWLLGIAVVAALILGPILVTYAEDSAPPPPKHDKKADGGKAGLPEVQLTPAQEDALGDEVKNFREALGKLQAKSEAVLNDRNQARKFVMQTVMKEMKAAYTEGADAKRDARKKAGK